MLSRTSDIYNLKIANRLKTSPFFRLAFYIMENWGSVEEFKNYEISSLGRVKTLNYKKERFLKPAKDKDGYLKVVLHNNENIKTFRVHQLVAMAFLNHKQSGMKLVINHINKIRSDNRLINIEILTQKENIIKKY